MVNMRSAVSRRTSAWASAGGVVWIRVFFMESADHGIQGSHGLGIVALPNDARKSEKVSQWLSERIKLPLSEVGTDLL